MKTHQNKILARIGVFFVAIVELVTVIGSLPVFADDVTIDNVQQKIQEAAIAHVVANTMKKCAASVAVVGDGFNAFHEPEDVLTSTKGVFEGTTNIAVGPWMENRIQNKVDDGDIWCKNEDGKIVSVFATTMGVSVKDVICGIDDQGGLMMGYERDQVGYQSATCSSGNYFLGNGTVDDRKAALKKIYDQWATNNPYAVSWDDIGYFNQVDGYYLYLNDLKTMCTGSGIDLTYTSVTSNAGLAQTTHTVNSANNSKNINSFVEGAKNCSTLASKVTDYAPLFQAEVKSKLNDSCKSAVLSQLDEKEAEAQAIVDDPSSYSAEDVQKAQDQLTEIQAARASSDYLEGNDTDGYTCKTVAGIVVTQLAPVDPAETVGVTDPDSTQPSCFNSAESLGWIICPILDITSNLLNTLYERIFQDFIEVKASMLAENGMRQAWQSFQTFANIVFVILLLVVIISQLTGVGIDNLGIKRILPRLIIAIILVNVSYILCTLAVDVSNIAGSGLYDLFNTMSQGITVSDPAIGVGQGVGVGVLTLIVGAILGAGLWISYGGVAGMILAIFPAVIAGVVSLLFTLILLGARQAGVVILTVISPLAIVMYMLPNTKKFYDRWIKMFSGLLLLYPIVGALVGGSNFASALLLSTGNEGFFFLLTAMLINIVPFFFIPTLLRGSFTAIGNIGNRIGSLGQRLGGRASGALRRNEAYRNAMDLARSGYKYNKEGKLVERKFGSAALKRRFVGRGGFIGRAASRSLAHGTAEARRLGEMDARADAINDTASIVGAIGAVKTAKDVAKSAKTDLKTASDNVRSAEADLADARRRLATAQSVPNADQAVLNAAQLDVQVMEDALQQRRQEYNTALAARNTAVAEVGEAKKGIKQARVGMAATANNLVAGARNTSMIQGEAERSRLLHMSTDRAISAARAGLASKQEREDINDLKSLARSGRMESVSGGYINVNSIDTLRENYEDALAKLANNPENTDAQARVKALGEILSDQGDSGMSAVANAFTKMYSSGVTTMNGGKGQIAMQLASAHLLDGYGGQYKSGNRGMFAMLGEAAAGKFDKLGSSFNADEWLSKGADKYTKSALSDAHEAALAGLTRTMENGSMSASDRLTLGNTARAALSDYRAGLMDIKPENVRILERIANYSDKVNVDASGNMTETSTSADGRIRTTSLGNSNDMGIHLRDTIVRYNSASQRREAATAVLNNTASTEAQKSQASTDIAQADDEIKQAQADIRTDYSVLNRSAEGRRVVRNALLETITAGSVAGAGSQFVANTIDPMLYEDGFRQVLGDINSSNPIQAGSITQTVAGTQNAAGGPISVGEYTTSHEDSASAPYRLYDPSTGNSVEVRNIGGDIRQYRDTNTNTWHDITTANANTYDNYKTISTAENSYNSSTNEIVRTITLDGGQTVRERVGAVDDVAVKITEAIRNLNGLNGSRTDQQNEVDRAFIIDNSRAIISSSDGGNYTRGIIAQTAAGVGNIAGEGSKLFASTIQSDAESLNAGLQSYLDEVRRGIAQSQAITVNSATPNSYNIEYEKTTPVQTVYNPITGETKTIRQVDNRGSYQEIDSGTGISRTINRADLRDFVSEADNISRVSAMQTSQLNYINTMIAQGTKFAQNARFSRVPAGTQINGKTAPAGYSAITDESGHVHYYNHRSGTFTVDSLD